MDMKEVERNNVINRQAKGIRNVYKWKLFAAEAVVSFCFTN